MSEALTVRVYVDGRPEYEAEFAGPLEVGRQKRDETVNPVEICDGGGRARLVIAPKDDTSLPRRFLLVKPLGCGRVQLTNLSDRVALTLRDGSLLGPEESREEPLPLRLELGNRAVVVTEPAEVGLQSLSHFTLPPGAVAPTPPPRPATTADIDLELARSLQAVIGMLSGAVSSGEFFQLAASAVLDLGLDSGLVLLREGGKWVKAAEAGNPGPPSDRVLNAVRSEARTYWEQGDLSGVGSLRGVRAVVAAPILDRQGKVIGVIYGDRRSNGSDPLTLYDALLVETLAVGAATGLLLVEREREAQEANLRFEQFMGRELAQFLTEHPEMMNGRDAEVTVLFCDIRAFTRISGRVGPVETLEWINDTLETLSQCVRSEDGVVVNYIGDELLAMWGAPREQKDQAERACRAALAMKAALPALNERWRDRLQGEPVALGIGVNTGVAQVGNIGTRSRLLYGPLGPTVNLASRVQGATKFLQTDVLVTGATRKKLGEGFAVRRLCQAAFVNLDETAELYELAVAGALVRWDEMRDRYEAALSEFERHEFRSAVRLLGGLLPEFRADGPSLVLLKRAVNALVDGAEPHHPVWKLTEK